MNRSRRRLGADPSGPPGNYVLEMGGDPLTGRGTVGGARPIEKRWE